MYSTSFKIVFDMNNGDVTTELAKQEVKPRIYSYNELRIATHDFHLDNKLGEGGFGVVYKVHKNKVRVLEGYHVGNCWI